MSWPLRRYWWAYLLMGVLILAVVLALIAFDDDETDVTLSQFVAFTQAGEVTSIRVDDNDRDFKFKLSNRDGTYETTKEREVPLRQLLLDAGVTNDEINGIELAVDSGDSSSVGSLIVNFLPIFIIIAIVSFFLWQAGRGIQAKSIDLPYDPVCKVSVSVSETAATSGFGNVSYRFCSKEHKAQFDADPVKYLHIP